MPIFSLLPLLLAAFAGFVLGAIWYAPSVFGRWWMRAAGVTPEGAERAARFLPGASALSFLGMFVTASALRFILASAGVYGLLDALKLAIVIWAAFAVPPLLGPVLWEGKTVRLFLINGSYWLTATMLMAAILVS